MNETEASCSFKFIVGSACSYDRRDRSKLFKVDRYNWIIKET